MDAGIELKDMMIGCTAGVLKDGLNDPVSDLNYNEESMCRAH